MNKATNNKLSGEKESPPQGEREEEVEFTTVTKKNNKNRNKNKHKKDCKQAIPSSAVESATEDVTDHLSQTDFKKKTLLRNDKIQNHHDTHFKQHHIPKEQKETHHQQLNQKLTSNLNEATNSKLTGARESAPPKEEEEVEFTTVKNKKNMNKKASKQAIPSLSAVDTDADDEADHLSQTEFYNIMLLQKEKMENHYFTHFMQFHNPNEQKEKHHLRWDICNKLDIRFYRQHFRPQLPMAESLSLTFNITEKEGDILSCFGGNHNNLIKVMSQTEEDKRHAFLKHQCRVTTGWNKTLGRGTQLGLKRRFAYCCHPNSTMIETFMGMKAEIYEVAYSATHKYDQTKFCKYNVVVKLKILDYVDEVEFMVRNTQRSLNYFGPQNYMKFSMSVNYHIKQKRGGNFIPAISKVLQDVKYLDKNRSNGPEGYFKTECKRFFRQNLSPSHAEFSVRSSAANYGHNMEIDADGKMSRF